jgi:hypothetical protein
MVDVRNRLVKALHTSATLPSLREELVLVLCDMAAHEEAAPTVRSVVAWAITDANGHKDRAPDTEPDSAPPTPADSELGKEYGI